MQHRIQEEMIKADALIGNDCVCHSVPSDDGNADCRCGSPSFVFLPPLVDLHVHFRVPGNPEKETIMTGTMAARAGGYGLVCTMPNLNPYPDSLENLKVQLDVIGRDAAIAIYPYATITKGEKGEELSDMDALAPHCVAFLMTARAYNRLR